MKYPLGVRWGGGEGEEGYTEVHNRKQQQTPGAPLLYM